MEINLLRYNPLTSSSCMILHILFVNYLLMAGGVNQSMATSLKFALDSLASYMGLEVNKDKSIICGTRNHKNSFFKEIINVMEGSFPFKYFGLPLNRGALKAYHLNVPFDKIID